MGWREIDSYQQGRVWASQLWELDISARCLYCHLMNFFFGLPRFSAADAEWSHNVNLRSERSLP